MKELHPFQSFQKVLDKNKVILSPEELIVYERDASQFHGKPQAVVFPCSTEDIIRIMRWSSENKVAVVARGAGTGLSGGAVAEKGGIIVEFSRMNRILEFDPQGRCVVVEPGVINQSLDELVRTEGLYYPPDPSSGRVATIGGNVAENAGGPHCFKYGVTANYLSGLEIVLPDGRRVHLGGRAMDYPEYDLCSLLAGSEGTLGIISKIELRLVRHPPGIKTLMAVFDTVEQAGASVSAVIAAGLVPSTMEMMDQNVIRVVEDYVHAGLPVEAGAILIIDVDGYLPSLDPQINEIAEIIQHTGGKGLHIARNADERENIWFARKSAAGAFAKLGLAYFTLDGTVPRSLLAQALETSNRIAGRHKLLVVYVFHAGDGNLHPHIFFNPEDAVQVAAANHAVEEITQEVVSLGGSITGEHGIGIEKRQFLALMYSPEEIGIMLDVKKSFDPQQLLNPGKIFPLLEAIPLLPNQGPDKPGEILTPRSVEEASRALSSLSKAARPVLIRRSPSLSDLTTYQDYTLLDTSAFNKILNFAPDDLYIQVGAGLRLAEVQAFLASKGKQLALASPWIEATIGGLAAANVNAPLRMRYGSLRDQVLAMTIVLGDGRTIRAGRPVMKNVAGYDLQKVLVGSFGTLGLITDLTLKFTSQPRARQTLLWPIEDLECGLNWAMQNISLTLVASAVVLYKDLSVSGIPLSPYGLAYTAEGDANDVRTELDMVKDRMRVVGAPLPLEVASPSGTDLWAALLGGSQPGMVKARVGVAPKDLAAYVLVQSHWLDRGPFLIDIHSGITYATANLDSAAEAKAWVEHLRQPALERGGYAIVLESPLKWKQELDLWGYHPEALPIMKEIKRRWDPAGILNPGAFVVT